MVIFGTLFGKKRNGDVAKKSYESHKVVSLLEKKDKKIQKQLAACMKEIQQLMISNKNVKVSEKPSHIKIIAP